MKPSLLNLMVLSGITFAQPAFAESYAAPPDEPVIARQELDDSDPEPYRIDSAPIEGSPVRIAMGGCVKPSATEAPAGITARVEIGKGPASFHGSGSWIQIGSPGGLAQYSGELDLDLIAKGRWRPHLGAGAGLAQIYASSDSSTTAVHTTGIGVGRASMEYRIPMHNVDARITGAITGALPAVRNNDVPNSSGWALIGITLGIGL